MAMHAAGIDNAERILIIFSFLTERSIDRRG